MKRTFRLAAIGFLCLGAGRSHVMPAGGQGGHAGNRELAGRWLMSLNEADGVQLSVRMTFAVSGPTDSPQWEAWSRQGAAREMVGGATAVLGRLVGRMPPREALIYIGKGTSQNRADTLDLSGELESPFLGRRAFRGTLVGGRLHAELTRIPSGAAAGTISGVRDSTDDPVRDYVSLAADLERAIEATIFDPSIVRRGEYRRFVEELRRRFGRARDDLDVIAAFQALKPSLGISHFELIRNPRLAALPRDSVIAGDATVNRDRYVVLGFPAPEVAHLRVTRWDRVESAVHRAFERMDSVGTRFLILDIRGNPGGDASSMAPLTHLIRDTVTVGVFLGPKWYASNRTPPTASQFSSLPALTSDTTPAQLFDDIRAHGAVVGRAAPRAPYFAGAVYLLVDRRTGSASEPLAHVLRTTRRATVIGDRTAGAMLTALPQPLRDGWVAVIPEADFITGDGVRLEGAGVEPHVRSSPNDVFLAVAERITGVAPFAGTVLRAGSLEGLQRPADAEPVYRDALRMADQQSPAPRAAWRALLHKRLAIILTAKGDSAGARREYEEVLRLTPNDAQARAALRRGTSAPRVLIRAGRLLDVRTGEIVRNTTITVEHDRITNVATAVRPSPGDSILDLSAYTVLPGLIDAHVHLTIGGSVRSNAQADLDAGFTTVVDLGARSTRILAIRDSINAGRIPGPRVLAAGIWIGRKDGVCEFNGIGIPGGSEGFRTRVRENAHAGADVIKACVSGWPADAFSQPDRYELPDSVLAAIVDESRRFGRKVIAHDISLAGVQAAVRAGVHGLAHAAYLDSTTAGAMRARGMFMIPTLASLTSGDSTPASRALVESTRLANRAGVALVFGTDGGVLPHGENATEFTALVRAGIPPLDAIRSATIGAAGALGIADSVGVIAPAMVADIIAVDGDPLADVASLGRVRFVMSRGRVVRSPPK